jgi:hypothetical protein
MARQLQWSNIRTKTTNRFTFKKPFHAQTIYKTNGVSIEYTKKIQKTPSLGHISDIKTKNTCNASYREIKRMVTFLCRCTFRCTCTCQIRR